MANAKNQTVLPTDSQTSLGSSQGPHKEHHHSHLPGFAVQSPLVKLNLLTKPEDQKKVVQSLDGKVRPAKEDELAQVPHHVDPTNHPVGIAAASNSAMHSAALKENQAHNVTHYAAQSPAVKAKLLFRPEDHKVVTQSADGKVRPATEAELAGSPHTRTVL